MASIFKRGGKGPWLVSYFDTDPQTGKRRRREKSTGTGDKAIAKQIAARLDADARLHKKEAEGLVELRRRGLSDPVRERLAKQTRTPLDSHLAAFVAMLEGKGNTPKYVGHVVTCCGQVAERCRFRTPADIDAVKVAELRSSLKAEGLSPQSVNHKIAAFKGFVQWLHADGRLPTNPLLLIRKLNADVDRRRRRRALTDPEIARLIAAAESGPPVLGMAGPDRAMLYRIGVATGLRSSELKSLTPASFAVADPDAASVVVEAACSKRRRRDVLPLDRETAKAVARFIGGKPPTAPLFGALPHRAAQMMRADMDAARPWIPYKDARGRVADFHALRATFITRLVRAGVAPAVCQRLARHSDIRLTLTVYADVTAADMRAALAKLPKLPPAGSAETDAGARATGTDGGRDAE